MPTAPGGDERPTAVVGRYAIYDAVASGGMATVHLGRLLGSAGFLRTVAIKRLHPQFAHDKDFAAMFLDEARLAARVQHPNVVPTLDVVVDGTELLLVMEYVRGVSLSQLTRAARDQGIRLPPRVVVAIMCGALHGLHAAHEATDEKGDPLDLVHRDVSPQNVLVGVDGTARVLDFGIAKAAGRVHATREGEIKGKLLYMPPEQMAAEPLSRATDIYAAGIVLFESLTNVRMFAGEQEAAAIKRIIQNDLRMPSTIAPELAPFDAIVARAAAGEAKDRFPTAFDMARTLEQVMTPATPAEVGEWVQRLGAGVLDERAKMVAHVERSSTRSKPPPAVTGSDPRMLAAQLAAHMSAPFANGTAPSSGSMPSAPVASGTFSSGIQARPAGVAVGHDGSQPTMTMVQPAPRRSWAMLFVGALLALLLVAIGVIAFLVLRPQGPAAAATAAPSASAAPEVTATAEPSASAAVVTTPVVTTPVVASASAPPSATAVAHPIATATPAVKPAVVKPKVSCDPPYTIDKKGHRHFIPECVQ
jgi:serine/threonine-protein kinase